MITDHKSNSSLEKKKNQISAILISLLPLLSLLITLAQGIYHQTSGDEIAKIGIITLILTGTITFFIRFNTKSLPRNHSSTMLIVISYLFSLTLLFMTPNAELLSLWMICGLMIAMLIDQKLGLLCNFILVFILGFHRNLNSELLLQLLIICVLLSVLSGAIKNKSTVVYAVIIILAINITLAFVLNNFMFEKSKNFDYVQSLFSVLTVIIVSYIIAILYHKYWEKQSPLEGLQAQEHGDTPIIAIQECAMTQELLVEKNRYQKENQSISDDKVADNKELTILTSECSYELLCNLENELLQRLKDYSQELYLHGNLIGEISMRAAKLIGTNEMLAKAGGLYHEIGKINGAPNYIEEGLKLAQEYSFPEELKSIIREHNINFNKTTSVEAAIVMLTDNIVSTIDYIEKTKDQRYTTDMMIDHIFQMRLDKGTFDASGLSLTDYKRLKEFFKEEFKNKREVNETERKKDDLSY